VSATATSPGGGHDEARWRGVRAVLLVTLALNLAVAGAKVVVGYLFGLLSLTADGIHSTIDGLNNVVGLVAVASASRPPDVDHPYGHRKFETFAATGIAFFLVVAATGLIREAFERRQGGATPETGLITYAVAIGTIAVNAGVTRYERRRGRELRSEFLVADAAHTASDVLITVAVIAAMVAVDLKVSSFDFYAALGIAALILFTAGKLALRGLGVLSDQVAIDVREIERIVRAVEGVRACHKIRTRGPQGHVFADLHVQVDPEASVREGHRIAHLVVDAIRREIPGVQDVVTHLEPYEGPPATP
jgi:cation diffusion facilitator family transporter